MRALTFLVACAFGLLAAALLGQESARHGAPVKAPVTPDAKQYDEQVRPFLARHCLECHGGKKPKGDLRLDRLAPDFADAASRERWLAVLEKLKAGAMPPKPKPRPP